MDDRIEDAGREVPAHLVGMVPVGLMQFEVGALHRGESPRFADGRYFADAVVSLDAFQGVHARSRQRVLGTRVVLPLEELVDQRNRPGLLREFSELHRVVKVVLVAEAWLLALVLEHDEIPPAVVSLRNQRLCITCLPMSLQGLPINRDLRSPYLGLLPRLRQCGEKIRYLQRPVRCVAVADEEDPVRNPPLRLIVQDPLPTPVQSLDLGGGPSDHLDGG